MRFRRILHVLETQDFYIFNNFPARIYILVKLETNFASMFQKKKICEPKFSFIFNRFGLCMQIQYGRYIMSKV